MRASLGMGFLQVQTSSSEGADPRTSPPPVQAGIKFPSSLVGMFFITVTLIAMGEQKAAAVRSFFAPALSWIGKWLSVFYIAPLVCLPLGIKFLEGSELVGAYPPASLIFALFVSESIFWLPLTIISIRVVVTHFGD